MHPTRLHLFHAANAVLRTAMPAEIARRRRIQVDGITGGFAADTADKAKK